MLTCRCLVSLFLTFSCTRLHLTEPWHVTKESAFLKPAGFRKHKAPWPGRAEVSCTVLTHQYFMFSLASYPSFHTRTVKVKVEHFWRSRRKNIINNSNERGWGLFLPFYQSGRVLGHIAEVVPVIPGQPSPSLSQEVASVSRSTSHYHESGGASGPPQVYYCSH